MVIYFQFVQLLILFVLLMFTEIAALRTFFVVVNFNYRVMSIVHLWRLNYMEEIKRFYGRYSWYLSHLMTKPTKWHVHPAKTQISLGIRPVWSEALLFAWRKLVSLGTHWAHSEDSDQTDRMLRLIWVFAGRTVILLVLSWGGSFKVIDNSFTLSNITWLTYTVK